MPLSKPVLRAVALVFLISPALAVDARAARLLVPSNEVPYYQEVASCPDGKVEVVVDFPTAGDKTCKRRDEAFDHTPYLIDPLWEAMTVWQRDQFIAMLGADDPELAGLTDTDKGRRLYARLAALKQARGAEIARALAERLPRRFEMDRDERSRFDREVIDFFGMYPGIELDGDLYQRLYRARSTAAAEEVRSMQREAYPGEHSASANIIQEAGELNAPALGGIYDGSGAALVILEPMVVTATRGGTAPPDATGVQTRRPGDELPQPAIRMPVPPPDLPAMIFVDNPPADPAALAAHTLGLQADHDRRAFEAIRDAMTNPVEREMWADSIVLQDQFKQHLQLSLRTLEGQRTTARLSLMQARATGPSDLVAQWEARLEAIEQRTEEYRKWDPTIVVMMEVPPSDNTNGRQGTCEHEGKLHPCVWLSRFWTKRTVQESDAEKKADAMYGARQTFGHEMVHANDAFERLVGVSEPLRYLEPRAFLWQVRSWNAMGRPKGEYAASSNQMLATQIITDPAAFVHTQTLGYITMGVEGWMDAGDQLWQRWSPDDLDDPERGARYRLQALYQMADRFDPNGIPTETTLANRASALGIGPDLIEVLFRIRRDPGIPEAEKPARFAEAAAREPDVRRWVEFIQSNAERFRPDYERETLEFWAEVGTARSELLEAYR